jgi:hypothetical protein
VCEHHCNAVFVYDWASKWAYDGLEQLLARGKTSPPPVLEDRKPAGPTVPSNPANKSSATTAQSQQTAGPMLKRESWVVFGNLGGPQDGVAMKERLKQAKEGCNVTNIDFVLLSVR